MQNSTLAVPTCVWKTLSQADVFGYHFDVKDLLVISLKIIGAFPSQIGHSADGFLEHLKEGKRKRERKKELFPRKPMFLLVST